MRIRSPSSRATLRIRLSFFDAVLAAASPWLALYLRDAYILSYDGAATAAIYCLLSLVFSLIAFAAFGLRDGMPRFFSVHDAIDVAKAVLFGEFMTCVVLFTFTRLEGIPRSTPVIHALILGAGLVTARAMAHIADRDRKRADRPPHGPTEHIVLIGLSDLSALYLKVLEAYAPGQKRVIALLDEAPGTLGRSMEGVRVFGPPSHLQSLVEEFAVHGVSTDRVVVGGEAESLSPEALKEIERVCVQRNIELDFVPRLFGLSAARKGVEPARSAVPPPKEASVEFELPSYVRFKGFSDFFISLALVIALLPVWIVLAWLAFLDVGAPVLFWQQRLGLNGRQFLLHKFRTLRPPFDWRGRALSEDQRLSWIGQLLRKTRLDELPQLLNVLVGDMSLIGPRPLLPEDQPASPSVRLMVRPGISGWAQVNGGALLSASEKDALDEWYIRHASPWLDLRILGMTILSLVRGDRRSEAALMQALAVQGPPAPGVKAAIRDSAPGPLSVPVPR